MCTFLNRKLLKCENMEEFTLRTGNQSEGFSNFPPALVNRHENSTPLPSFEIYDAPDKFDSTFYPWGDYIFGCVLIIIGLISLLGNGLAVHVFGKKGRDIAVSEVFLLNIAVVDQFQVCASYLAAIISAFCHRWIFDDIGCKIYGAVCYFLGVATIMSLTSLAVFRYLRTCYPQKVHFLTSNQTWTRIVFPIYLYSLIWALLPLLGWGSYDVEPFGLSCTLAWGQPDLGGRSYILTASLCCVFLPTVVIIGSHVAIIIYIRRTGRLQMTQRTVRHARKVEIQLLYVTFCVCFGFLFAWLPYAAFSLWSAFGNQPFPPWITAIPVLLAKSSIAYNPVIYGLLTRRYRLDFTSALVNLVSWLSRKKQEHQDGAVVDPQPNRQIVKNNEQQIGLLGILQEKHLTALETINDRNQTQCVTSFNDRLFTSDESQIENHDISVPIDDANG